MVTTKRKRIKVRYGCVKLLAQKCKVSKETVRHALSYNSDSENENLVRKRAEELDYIRKF